MMIITVKHAAKLLISGEVVAIPTETVYGLAADARSDAAVSKIFKAKGRPTDNPLIVHIGDMAQVDALVTAVSAEARLLMEHFWPGALTIILPSSGAVSELVTAGLPTIGLRMPNHRIALRVLRISGIPLAAPSANVSGSPSPTHPEHVMYDLHDRIAGIIDSDVCKLGLESTIIDMTLDTPVILRPGCISKEEIEAIIGPVEFAAEDSPEKPKAPGMKYRHYAPNAKLYIVKANPRFVQSIVQELGKKKYGLKVGVLCHLSCKKLYKKAHVVEGIKTTGEDLYAKLRIFNQKNVDIIFSEYFDDVVVMNRLIKASGNQIIDESFDIEERILREMEDWRY